MGTRSLTRVIPRQKGLSYSDGHLHPEKAVVNMYRQEDGYPEGHGQDLADFLSKFARRGIYVNYESRKVANGTGCLAAQLVKHFKDDAGGIYLETCNGEPGDCWEQYIYTLYPKENEPTFMSIYNVCADKVIFVGTYEDLQSKYDHS